MEAIRKMHMQCRQEKAGMEKRKVDLVNNLRMVEQKISVMSQAFETTKALAQGLMKQGASKSDITKHLSRAQGIKRQVDQLGKARQELGANIQKAERNSLVLSGREEALRSALASF